MGRKKPTRKVNPTTEKRPRGKGQVERLEVAPISWHIRIADKKGPWGWSNVKEATFWSHIYPKLVAFETMTWGEIWGRNNHSVPKARIIREAQKRLASINQDDIDELVSLRLTGRKRIWGIKDGNVLKILWWDPEHQVCPSLLKFT